MPRKPTSIRDVGFIYRPTYADKKSGERKQSAVWWICYETDTEPVRRSLHIRDQEAAYAELLRIAGRVGTGEIADSSPEKVTFAELFRLVIADYEKRGLASIDDVRDRVEKHLIPAFGARRALDLRKAHIERFVDAMAEKDYAAATINRCLSIIRRALQLGADHDPPLVIRAIPKWFTKLQENERSGVVTAEQYRAILPHFHAPHVRLAFVIGYHTGLRKGAILDLRWEWVDWRAGVIRIPQQKKTTKRKPRTVPIYGDMRAFMEMAYTCRRTDFVIEEEGRPLQTIKTAWRAAWERAGLMEDTGQKRKDGTPLLKPLAVFHDLRRTAATMLHEAGYDLATIMDVCGWTSITMPKRYIQQSVQQVQRVGQRMEQFIAERHAAVREAEAKTQ